MMGKLPYYMAGRSDSSSSSPPTAPPDVTKDVESILRPYGIGPDLHKLAVRIVLTVNRRVRPLPQEGNGGG